MTQALIGQTGFVGSNLARSLAFDTTANSRNIEDLKGRHFHRVVCAGLPAAKWIANENPEEDWRNVQRLIEVLDTVTAHVFVLISTIDVYPVPLNVDEGTQPEASAVPEAYGRHRLEFEAYVQSRFGRHHVVRLPALFGPGLKKNAVFDLMHGNRIDWIHPDSSFQWYPVTRLAADLQVVEASGLPVVNIATQPLTMRDIQLLFFPDKKIGDKAGRSAHYDIRSRYSQLWGRSDGYCMDGEGVLQAMGSYISQNR